METAAALPYKTSYKSSINDSHAGYNTAAEEVNESATPGEVSSCLGN